MKSLPCLLGLLSALCAASAGPVDIPAQSAKSAAPTTTTASLPVQIITCREDVDLDAVIAEFKLAPKFIYRFINGFAAPMDAATIEQLKSDGRVLYVEADGPVAWSDQITPAGLRRMGIPNFPVARINHVNEPLDVDVAILDTGIDPHEDLNIVTNLSPFSLNGNDEVGHGTAVAGVLGAYDNGLGVVGVAAGPAFGISRPLARTQMTRGRTCSRPWNQF